MQNISGDNFSSIDRFMKISNMKVYLVLVIMFVLLHHDRPYINFIVYGMKIAHHILKNKPNAFHSLHNNDKIVKS